MKIDDTIFGTLCMVMQYVAYWMYLERFLLAKKGLTLSHSCKFSIRYCHKVKIGLTLTKMVADHTIL